MESQSLPFVLYFGSDAYSMAGKIMGRNAAGHSLLRAAASHSAGGVLHATGRSRADATAMRDMLGSFGSDTALNWHALHRPQSIAPIGALYYPAPPIAQLAAMRNAVGPGAFSCFGVTHTLSSESAMSLLSALALPPFKPWDALICTSQVTRDVFDRLRARTQEDFARATGATRFPEIMAPIIPLGIVTADFAENPQLRGATRTALGLAQDSVMILSLGRLSFHAKYNPAPLYLALESLPDAQKSRVVLVECGVYPNDPIGEAYRAAQRELMPSVRCIKADGADAALRAGLWQAADMFVSLSDNIQETYGLSPVEAMAAGLPVVATDWNGYRDTVRDGVDGFLVPTMSAPPGAGADLALRHAVNVDTYDMYIGRVSLATMCDPEQLKRALSRLIGDDALRRRMGAAGRERARRHFDWSTILSAYAELCGTLAELRRHHLQDAPEAWPARPDPFSLFETYPTRHLSGEDAISVLPGAEPRFHQIARLGMANYGFDQEVLPPNLLLAMLTMAGKRPLWRVNELIAASGQHETVAQRALLWLAKFNLIAVGLSGQAEA